MNYAKYLIAALMFALLLPTIGEAKNKKKQGERGMLENMEAVPCGAKEHGLAGLGSVFASVGVTKMSSDEKLCSQYLLRTDEMEYHIRPVDKKHNVLLPVGHEAVFKIKKDVLFLKVPDGNKEYKKTRKFQVVGMSPLNNTPGAQDTAYRPASHLAEPRLSQEGKVPSNDVGTPPPP